MCLRFSDERQAVAAAFLLCYWLALVPLSVGQESMDGSGESLMPMSTTEPPAPSITPAPSKSSTSDADTDNDVIDFFDDLVADLRGRLILSIACIGILITLCVFILCIACCVYCSTAKRLGKEAKALQMAFGDVEEAELVTFKVKDSENGGGEQSTGEGTVKLVEGEHTLSTFGHTVEVMKEGNETREGENDEEVTEKSSKSEEGKSTEKAEDAKGEESSKQTGQEVDKNKQKVDAVEAVESSKPQPVPVAPPIIFNLSPATAKMDRKESSDADETSTKEKSTDDSSATKVTTESSDEKSPDTGVANEKKTEDETKEAPEVAPPEKSGPPESAAAPAEKSEKPESGATAEPENIPKAVIIGFDDIEDVLGMALKDLGNF